MLYDPSSSRSKFELNSPSSDQFILASKSPVFTVVNRKAYPYKPDDTAVTLNI